MQGVYIALDAFSAPGADVIVQTPVYPPFLKSVRLSGRQVVENHLVPGAGRYEIDFDDLEAGFAAGARTLLLCHPQNPTGRVFEREELERIADLVCAYDGFVLSDEIHADLTFEGRRHVPLASLNDDIAARTVTLNSASKSFNIPALRCAVAHFGSADVQRRFVEHVPRRVRGGLGHLGLAATVAAWRSGDAWLEEIIAVLDENRTHLAALLAERLPELSPFVPEGTYMTWVDCAPLRLDGSPAEHFRERGKVALTDGRSFGSGYRSFTRINFATSPAILHEVVERMAHALGR
jgi:cystathionine beta-lyase